MGDSTTIFGLLNGSTWETYKISFVVSLQFPFSIRHALLAAEKWVVPNVLKVFGTPHPHWIVEGVTYSAHEHPRLVRRRAVRADVRGCGSSTA